MQSVAVVPQLLPTANRCGRAPRREPLWHRIDIVISITTNAKYMKTVLESFSAYSEKSGEKFHLNISLFMIIFFFIMGAASLYVLINSPA